MRLFSLVAGSVAGFEDLVLNEGSDAPTLQGEDLRTPLRVGLSAAWDPELGWHQLEIGEVEMAPAEVRRRSQRPSAGEEKLVDEEHSEG